MMLLAAAIGVYLAQQGVISLTDLGAACAIVFVCTRGVEKVFPERNVW